MAEKKIEEFGYERCDFDDECDLCGNPEGGSYARMIRHAESDSEADYYICGKCAMKIINDGVFDSAYSARLTPPSPSTKK